MALITLSLHEQHPDDITQGITSCEEEEEEQEQEEEDCDEIPCHRIYDNTAISHASLRSHLHRLRKRISKTHVPWRRSPHKLSPQAILLLGEAAATSSTSTSSPSYNIDPADAPLYAELESLRELIPPQPPKLQDAEERSPPACLITRALDYLDHMKREIRNLHESIHHLETFAQYSCSNYLGSASYMDYNESGLVTVEHACQRLQITCPCSIQT
ncbi:hypothetical protein GOP47_0003463 [Adiantum capillus-veneris]|uniref:BHLH domain-containing protein n=1 Tax=Adiantum capillus-veneris TaxID=13818 RepID=A0A9D4VCV9_ADICA|nr:hypothetical protein GOP47_0002921 [Adiantum capillus-veneris]KAI5083720.1 hypothetical protein GOP47_0003463 [Adiantum capillus-veneris]